MLNLIQHAIIFRAYSPLLCFTVHVSFSPSLRREHNRRQADLNLRLSGEITSVDCLRAVLQMAIPVGARSDLRPYRNSRANPPGGMLPPARSNFYMPGFMPNASRIQVLTICACITFWPCLTLYQWACVTRNEGEDKLSRPLLKLIMITGGR